MSKRYPKNDIVNMTTANQEYSYTFPVGTKAFTLQTRDGASFKYAFVAGNIALGTYVTAHQGIAKFEDNTGSEMAITIYLSSEEAGVTLEVELWR